MATLPNIFCLLTFFTLICYRSHVHGGEIQPSFHSIDIRTIIPSTICYSSTESSGNRLTVVHQHGPCSPNINPRQKLSHRHILQRDQARVASLHNRISTSKKNKSAGSLAGVTVPDRVGVSFSTLDYIVTVGFGTPKKQFSVIFDTGSDISWIQCEPCPGGCYAHNETFDPSQSSTYVNISCSSDDCLSFGSGCDASSTCIYAVQYGDGSYTIGFLARETLTLRPSNVLTNFDFGCGERNEGLFGSVAGLVGLGRGEVSLASQAAKVYGGVFSYCLPRRVSSTGYLTLGSSGPSPNVKFTPMLTEPAAPSFYFVELIGISVGGKNLSIPPRTFTDVGTIIDSGTVITRLPPSGYSALRDEFRRQMANYSMGPPLSIFDTCYNFRTAVDSIIIPSVGLIFSGGVTLDIDFSGILYVESLSRACLAFAGNDPNLISIIGNMQQRTYDIVYDVSRGMIGFGAGGCS